MLRQTVERLLPLVPVERQIIVTGAILGQAIRDALPELPAGNVLEEPTGRNTAPAIGWAAQEVLSRDPDATLAILPADQFIANEPNYREVVMKAVHAAERGRRIVTLGIPPTRPETGYGYIRSGGDLPEGGLAVEAFKEKPDLPTALEYLKDGGYLWNAGMFFTPAALILEELGTYAPDVRRELKKLEGPKAESVDSVYPTIPSISIDYAVMEQTERIAVIPGEFGWSDVGSWRTLWDYRSDGESTFTMGDVIEIDGSGNVLFSQQGTIATVGVSDLVVVHTSDATLVCPRESAQRIREVVNRLKDEQREELL